MNTFIIIGLIIIFFFLAAVFMIYSIFKAVSPEALKVFFGHDDAENTEYTDSPQDE